MGVGVLCVVPASPVIVFFLLLEIAAQTKTNAKQKKHTKHLKQHRHIEYVLLPYNTTMINA